MKFKSHPKLSGKNLIDVIGNDFDKVNDYRGDATSVYYQAPGIPV